jgi:hypothetical protein
MGQIDGELRDEMREMRQQVNEIRRQLTHMSEGKAAPPR